MVCFSLLFYGCGGGLIAWWVLALGLVLLCCCWVWFGACVAFLVVLFLAVLVGCFSALVWVLRVDCWFVEFSFVCVGCGLGCVSSVV